MKKVFALALTVLMVMSMFAGCGSSNTAKTTTAATEAPGTRFSAGVYGSFSYSHPDSFAAFLFLSDNS